MFESSACNAKLTTCFNQLMMLSNSQFVENRVFDDEEDEDEDSDGDGASGFSRPGDRSGVSGVEGDTSGERSDSGGEFDLLDDVNEEEVGMEVE